MEAWGGGPPYDENPIKVSIDQFYGIEINDFAVAVAKTALWIAEEQMMDETQEIMLTPLQFLPLTSNENIIQANALRYDWNDLLPAAECSYVIGNPPFVGYSLQTESQKTDLLDTAVDLKGNQIDGAGNLDYVCGWFFKAAQYMYETPIVGAFVSTNSISQGELAVLLWKPLIEEYGLHICFAHRSFVWNSEANDRAQVHVVVVGFSYQAGMGIIYDEDARREVETINGYLIDGPICFIQERREPICSVEKMQLGVDLTDYGYLNFTSEEKEAFIASEPGSEPYFKKYLDAKGFTHNKLRYYLDLRDCDELEKLPLCEDRIAKVSEARRNAKSKATQKRADRPLVPKQGWMPDSDYLIIPRHTSSNRDYVPIGFMSKDIVATMANQVIPNATLYEFGVLSSLMHNAWIKQIAGRIKSDYRYGAGLVYNNFVWPDPTPEQKQAIEQAAQTVLDVREAHSAKSLADLYDPAKMPSDLLAAHKALDKAVEEAYGVDFDGDEEKIVAHLFKLYAQTTGSECWID